MLELLNKYYEYFLKQEEKGKNNFKDFYNLIINSYDLSKNGQIEVDIVYFFEFFDKTGMFGITKPGEYSQSNIDKKGNQEEFEKNSETSFPYFIATKYMVENSKFVYSVKNSKEKFCKAYISIKPEQYVKTLIKLQQFVDQLYKKYNGKEEIGQIKFRNKPANDAITMRFASEKHYNEFIEFLNENKDIKESFDIPNPFLPQDSNGLSIISDNGESYNYFVAKTLWDYMCYCEDNNIKITIEGIVEFINNYDHIIDEIMLKFSEKIIEVFAAAIGMK